MFLKIQIRYYGNLTATDLTLETDQGRHNMIDNEEEDSTERETTREIYKLSIISELSFISRRLPKRQHPYKNSIYCV